METNALTQYNELIAGHRAAIEAGSPAAMNGAVRDRAIKTLGQARLPRRGDEGYEYTDLEAILSPDLGVNINRHGGPTDLGAVYKCGVPNISSLLGVTVNDMFRPTDTLLSRLPEGVTVKAFSKADGDDLAVIEKCYGTVADSSKTEVALNTALAQDGVLVRIGRNVTLDRPIQLVNILEALTAPDGGSMPVLATRRLLIVAEPGSSADILVCDHDRAADGQSVTSRVNEIIVGENASLNCYELEEGSGKTARLTETAVRMERDSRLGFFSGTLKGGQTRNNFTVNLDGPGASLNIDGMVIADGDQVIDNSATVFHNTPECHSNQTFKYIVSDRGRGAFEGLIKVAHGAHHTEAYQNDRNLLASPTARMHSRPQLEIYCDDVKCSHGAATGQLDARALFYMRSRGIDEPEARSMLMKAFMADVIDSIKLEPLRDRLRHLTDMRLSGDGEARCEGCNAC